MLLKLMQGRRSVRRFKEEKLPGTLIDKLIQAAITAPSAGNKQPWRFLIVSDREMIESAAREVREACIQTLKKLRPAYREDFDRYAVNFSMFQDAPVIIVPCYRAFSSLSHALIKDADESVMAQAIGIERDCSLLSTGMAIQNILLMAHGLGLAACCMTGPLLAGDRLSTLLKTPEGWQVSALLAVGYADENPDDPGRKAFQSFIIKR